MQKLSANTYEQPKLLAQEALEKEFRQTSTGVTFGVLIGFLSPDMAQSNESILYRATHRVANQTETSSQVHVAWKTSKNMQKENETGINMDKQVKCRRKDRENDGTCAKKVYQGSPGSPMRRQLPPLALEVQSYVTGDWCKSMGFRAATCINMFFI